MSGGGGYIIIISPYFLDIIFISNDHLFLSPILHTHTRTHTHTHTHTHLIQKTSSPPPPPKFSNGHLLTDECCSNHKSLTVSNWDSYLLIETNVRLGRSLRRRRNSHEMNLVGQ